MSACAGKSRAIKGPHSSGHAYFTLKDDKARIEAVIWRLTFQRLRFKPQEGSRSIATGKLTTFPGSSKYQIVIESARAGRRRRADGAARGAAEEARRRGPFRRGAEEAPPLPAAHHRRRHLADRRRDPRHPPSPRRPLPGAGPGLAGAGPGRDLGGEVAAAIRGFNAAPGGRLPQPDLIIVARGGGSLEDLWGFNDEIVVRAAAASAIPLISAVGHETDFDALDFVADRRAPTPTAAAEMAVPVRSELIAAMGDLSARHYGAMLRAIETSRRELRAAARALPKPEDLFAIGAAQFRRVVEPRRQGPHRQYQGAPCPL